jgi:predicted PurR-regulated permease PerM
MQRADPESWQAQARMRGPGVSTLASVAIVAAALHFAQGFFVPVALALLISLALAPLVTRLDRLGLGRAPAVVAVMLLLVLALGGATWLVGSELVELSSDLPRFQRNLAAKARALRGPLGSLARAGGAVSEFERELEAAPLTGGRPPAKVEVVEASGPFDTLGSVLSPVLDNLAVVGGVAVLALFILLLKEDLRDRILRLSGSRHLSFTTSALDEVSQRVSRYLAMQSLLCGIHGSLVAIGLWAIGIPGALVFGALAAVLRFIPYLGPWVAAVLPIALSVVAFDGWTPALLTAGFLVSLELVSNNVLEPWLYGSSAGLSPFAIIVAAFAWTGLWGLPGLLLATPFTVCLVVLGRHVRGFEIFAILLGDGPVLDLDARFYQRLLARDREEAGSILREALEQGGVWSASAELVQPALARLALDEERQALGPEQAAEVRQLLAELQQELDWPGVRARASPAT